MSDRLLRNAMDDIQDLADRINAETSAQEEKARRLQQEWVDSFAKRRQRYHELFLPALERMKRVWFPRLQLLAEKLETLAAGFGDSVKSAPTIRPSPEEPHSGEMTFSCESPLAKVRLTFSFCHDLEIRHLVVDYDLEIIPIFLQFEPHSRLEQSLDQLDEASIARWLDDRIVHFVRTYLAIHENYYYLRDHMVEDPIAQVRFPKYAAKATLQKDGVTYYFISPETQREFQNSHFV